MIVVAVDFDGTITQQHDYPEIGAINPLAKMVLPGLKKSGVVLILWTCREGQHLKDAVDFCKFHGIEFDAVNENAPNLPFSTSRKIYADIYIDDRAIPVDWILLTQRVNMLKLNH